MYRKQDGWRKSIKEKQEEVEEGGGLWGQGVTSDRNQKLKEEARQG